MKTGADFYNLYREDRPYLPEWSQLTTKEQKPFNLMATGRDGILGGIYRRFRRDEIIKSTGHLMKHPANLCGEITLPRIDGLTRLGLRLPGGGWLKRGKGW